jgi:cytochrome c oxidase subunit 3
MAIGGMLAVYLTQREASNSGIGKTTSWVPKGVVTNDVAANTILITMVAASVMIQWAVHSLRQGDRRHAAYGLGITALFGVAVLTAQARIWQDYAMVASKTVFATLVYAVTGTYAVLIATGVLVAAAAAFRTLGGRTGAADREVLSAAALWWHFLTVVTGAVWFFVYVVK